MGHFLRTCTGYQTKLTDDDQLAVIYHLLLQDRIEEALEAFAKVNAANVPEKMQYDYCAAYLALFTDAPESVRAAVGRPVLDDPA